MTSILELDDLTLRRGGRKVLERFSCRVHEGSLTAIVGPRGAGKAALLDVISGQDRGGAGQVRFRGRDISGLGPAARARRGLVRTFERAELFPDLDVAEHVRLAVQARRRRGSRLLGLASADRKGLARTAAILDAARLGEHAETVVTALSRAVRRRLEVAMMMAMEPDLCLFEAPTAGLARDDAAMILGFVAAMNRRDGRTILLVEHDMDLMTDIADRILVMQAGWLVADGPPEAVLAAPQDMDPAAGPALAHG